MKNRTASSWAAEPSWVGGNVTIDRYFKTGRQVLTDDCRSLSPIAKRLDEDAFSRRIELLLEATAE